MQEPESIRYWRPTKIVYNFKHYIGTDTPPSGYLILCHCWSWTDTFHERGLPANTKTAGNIADQLCL